MHTSQSLSFVSEEPVRIMLERGEKHDVSAFRLPWGAIVSTHCSVCRQEGREGGLHSSRERLASVSAGEVLFQRLQCDGMLEAGRIQPTHKGTHAHTRRPEKTHAHQASWRDTHTRRLISLGGRAMGTGAVGGSF